MTQEVRLVKLPKGETLELTIFPGFYEKVRTHFVLEPGAYISDDHLRMFVFGSLKTAVDKAEVEAQDARKEVPERVHRPRGRKSARRKKDA